MSLLKPLEYLILDLLLALIVEPKVLPSPG